MPKSHAPLNRECTGCGQPAHASETDDAGYHPRCIPSKHSAKKHLDNWLNDHGYRHSHEPAMPTRSKRRKPASQLDQEIRESMLVSDAEIEAFLKTLDVIRDPEDQGLVDDVYSALIGNDKARVRLTAIIRPARLA
jgi:hypothetical protein